MLLDDLDSDVGYFDRLNMHVFDRVLDRNAIHELFKLDSSLKKAYTTFAGDNIINVDGGLTWEEVRGLSLGMEVKIISVDILCPPPSSNILYSKALSRLVRVPKVEGFLNFADSYAICPSLISPEVTYNLNDITAKSNAFPSIVYCELEDLYLL